MGDVPGDEALNFDYCVIFDVIPQEAKKNEQ